MNTFNYQDAQLELNKRIGGGEVPEGAIAVEGYGFAFKGGHKNLTYTERRGPQDDLQDIIGVGGRWFFVHIRALFFLCGASLRRENLRKPR